MESAMEATPQENTNAPKVGTPEFASAVKKKKKENLVRGRELYGADISVINTMRRALSQYGKKFDAYTKEATGEETPKERETLVLNIENDVSWLETAGKMVAAKADDATMNSEYTDKLNELIARGRALIGDLAAREGETLEILSEPETEIGSPANAVVPEYPDWVGVSSKNIIRAGDIFKDDAPQSKKSKKVKSEATVENVAPNVPQTPEPASSAADKISSANAAPEPKIESPKTEHPPEEEEAEKKEKVSTIKYTDRRSATEGEPPAPIFPEHPPAPPTAVSESSPADAKGLGETLTARIKELKEAQKLYRELERGKARADKMRDVLERLDRANAEAADRLAETAAALKDPAIEREVNSYRAAFTKQDAAIENDARERGIFGHLEKISSWYSKIGFRYKLAASLTFFGLTAAGGALGAMVGVAGLTAQRVLGGIGVAVLTEASLQGWHKRTKGAYATGLRRDWYNALGIGVGALVGSGLAQEAVGKVWSAGIGYFAGSNPAEILADGASDASAIVSGGSVVEGGVGAEAAGEYAAAGGIEESAIGGDGRPPLAERFEGVGEAEAIPGGSAEGVAPAAPAEPSTPEAVRAATLPEGEPLPIGENDNVWKLTARGMEKYAGNSWKAMSPGQRIYFIDALTKELSKLPADQIKDIVPSGDLSVVGSGQMFHFEKIVSEHGKIFNDALNKASGLSEPIQRMVVQEAARTTAESSFDTDLLYKPPAASAPVPVVESAGFTVERLTPGVAEAKLSPFDYAQKIMTNLEEIHGVEKNITVEQRRELMQALDAFRMQTRIQTRAMFPEIFKHAAK